MILGSDLPFCRRICAGNFFKKSKIETGGTTYNNYVSLDVDGKTAKY